MRENDRLKHFPISFFAMVMGLAGLSIAWEKAQGLFGVELVFAPLLVGLTALAFVVLGAIYGIKLVNHRGAVIAELRHPIKLNFFPTLSISLLLLSIAFLPLSSVVSHPLWLAGALLHLGLTLYVINVWIHHEHFEVHHMNPAWFIPAVGNVLVPIAGIQFGYVEISWFFFSVGILFWLVLFTIIFYRVLFHHPLPGKLMPTLFILIAPPAVGFIAYVKLAGGLDGFGRFLYFSGLFLTLLLAVQIRRFWRLDFSLSWWAYSFPLAAITIASMLMFEITGNGAFQWIAAVLLLVVTLVVGLLLVLTGRAMRRREICAPEG